MRNKALLLIPVLLFSILILNLVSAMAESLAPYEIVIEHIDGYHVEYILYHTGNLSRSEELFNRIESEDLRPIDQVNYPNYTINEVGDNYWIDTWIAPMGRVYGINMYGNGWVLSAGVWKEEKEDRTNYKVPCKDKTKEKVFKHKCKIKNV